MRAWSHNRHKDQQLRNRQHCDDQLEAGSDLHANNVEGHEQKVGAYRRGPRMKRRVLHVQIGADRQGDGGWREHELHQRCRTGEVGSGRTEGSLSIREWAAGIRDGGGQFRKREDKGRVHGGDEDGRCQKSKSASTRPSIAPAKVLTGNDQTNRNGPKLHGGKRRFEVTRL